MGQCGTRQAKKSLLRPPVCITGAVASGFAGFLLHRWAGFRSKECLVLFSSPGINWQLRMTVQSFRAAVDTIARTLKPIFTDVKTAMR